MELKPFNCVELSKVFTVLIVPYGIETFHFMQFPDVHILC